MRVFLLLLSLPLAAPLQAQNCTTDDFEGPVGIPFFVNVGSNTIDENTVLPGIAGTGWVNDGCTYYTDGLYLDWWDYPTYLNSKCLEAVASTNPLGAMIGIAYDNDVDTVDVVLHGFFAVDTVDAIAYDAGGAILQQHMGLTVLALSDTAVNFSAPGIRSVEFYSSLTGGDSAFLGSHTYCSGSAGPSLTQAGTPGGVMTFDFAGFGAGESIAIVYGPGIPWAANAPCGAVSLDLTPLNFPPPSSLIIIGADANGDAQLVQNVPAGGAGLLVQGVGVGTCGVSNSVILP